MADDRGIMRNLVSSCVQIEALLSINSMAFDGPQIHLSFFPDLENQDNYIHLI